MGFAKPSDLAGASYFKPGDYETALALLVEPKTIDKGVPNEYPRGSGIVKPRDEVTADITVFKNQGDLEANKPSEVIKNVKVVHGMLTSSLEKILGSAMAAVVTKIPTKNGSGYVFRDLSPEDEAKVVAYYDGRESAVAEAVAAAPGFDD